MQVEWSGKESSSGKTFPQYPECCPDMYLDYENKDNLE